MCAVKEKIFHKYQMVYICNVILSHLVLLLIIILTVNTNSVCLYRKILLKFCYILIFCCKATTIGNFKTVIPFENSASFKSVFNVVLSTFFYNLLFAFSNFCENEVQTCMQNVFIQKGGIGSWGCCY